MSTDAIVLLKEDHKEIRRLFKAFQEADAKLNAVYKNVLAHIAESDLEKPYDRESWEKAMRESQRAWVAFRDADCKGAVPMEWSAGLARVQQ